MNQSPNLILKNAAIYTLAEETPKSAVAISGEKIIAVGEEKDVLNLATAQTKIIDLGGRTVIPAFTEAHSHFADFCLMLDAVNLENLNLPKVVEAVAKRTRAAPPGAWIIGRGWSEYVLGETPHSSALDSVSQKNPVLLYSHDCHAVWINTYLMNLAKIAKNAEEPKDGKIERDQWGNPTGVFFENACRLIENIMPRPSADDLAPLLKRGFEILHKHGIASVHDFSDIWTLKAYRALREKNSLGVRIFKIINPRDLELAIKMGLKTGDGDDRIRIGHYKIFADGALGVGTAVMHEPYSGKKSRGILIHEIDALYALMKRAVDAGFALAVHAIGDRANTLVLDGFEKIPKNLFAPHRIEHAQHLKDGDVKRFARLGVLASMQPVHMEDDIPIIRERLPDRIDESFPIGKLLKENALVAFGSDAPIADINPVRGLESAVLRRNINIFDAVKAYTLGGALASGESAVKGTIEAGKLADFAVLSHNPFSMEPKELFASLRVEGVVVGGDFVRRNF